MNMNKEYNNCAVGDIDDYIFADEEHTVSSR